MTVQVKKGLGKGTAAASRPVLRVEASSRDRGSSGRIALYDNAKLLLIALVVLGHLLQLELIGEYRMARAAMAFIYSFHMPLFIFISGLFVRLGSLRRETSLARAVTFVTLGYVVKLVNLAVRLLAGQAISVNLLSFGDVSWFMICLAAFCLMTFALQGMQPVAVMTASVVVSLVAGYVPWIGDMLCLSRILVFFPFFWLGCILNPSQVRDVFSDVRARRVCAVVLVVFALFCMIRTRRIYVFRDLFKGRYPYVLITRIQPCTWAHRLQAYAISLVVGAAFLGVVPRRDLGEATRMGQRTIQVYLFHYGLLLVAHFFFARWGGLRAIPLGWLVGVLWSGAVTWLLLLPAVGVPVDALMHAVHDLVMRKLTASGGF